MSTTKSRGKNILVMLVIALLSIGISVGAFFLVFYLVQLAYNGSVPKLGGKVNPDDEKSKNKMPNATYWQAACLTILLLLLVGRIPISINQK